LHARQQKSHNSAICKDRPVTQADERPVFLQAGRERRKSSRKFKLEARLVIDCGVSHEGAARAHIISRNCAPWTKWACHAGVKWNALAKLAFVFGTTKPEEKMPDPSIHEHHEKAAHHHDQAAKHHREAAKHHKAGAHEKAAHHSKIAHGHHLHATEHHEHTSKLHAEKHGS
jgi:hypothetical protein